MQGVNAARIIPAIMMVLSAGAALQAQALQILSLSPQGEVSAAWHAERMHAVHPAEADFPDAQGN